MRWLFQYGLRWIGSQVWRRASKSAAESASAKPSSQEDAPKSVVDSSCSIAIVVPSQRLFDIVADVLTGRKRIDAHQFALCTGRLGGERLLVARPTGEAPDMPSLLTALVDGHRPQFLLSAAEGKSLQESVVPGELVVANRVFRADGESLRLESSSIPMKGVHLGSIASLAPSEHQTAVPAENAPLAGDDWSWPVATAAKEVGLPLVAVCLVLEPTASQRSKEVDAMKKQTSFVGKAGVLAGMAWKKRSGLRELWNRQEADWEASGRLVELIKHLGRASQND